MIAAPVRSGVEVISVEQQGRPGFRVETSQGSSTRRCGRCDRRLSGAGHPAESSRATRRGADALHRVPQPGAAARGAFWWSAPGLRACRSLPNSSGRPAGLSVGRPARPAATPLSRPGQRWWLGVLGKWEAATPSAGTEHVTIAVSGADGGQTIDFRHLAGEGIILLGRTNGSATAPCNLRRSVPQPPSWRRRLPVGARRGRRLGRAQRDRPARGARARVIGPEPDCVTHPLPELDLATAGVTSVIWATGYSTDYGWLKVDAFDENGRPRHRRGVSREPGVYFLGLPWLSRRARASSGASGTMPNTLPTRSRSSAATPPTGTEPRRVLAGGAVSCRPRRRRTGPAAPGHQFQRPSRRIVAGTSSARTSVASTMIATIMPTPISLTNEIRPVANPTTTMTSSGGGRDDSSGALQPGDHRVSLLIAVDPGPTPRECATAGRPRSRWRVRTARDHQDRVGRLESRRSR